MDYYEFMRSRKIRDGEMITSNSRQDLDYYFSGSLIRGTQSSGRTTGEEG